MFATLTPRFLGWLVVASAVQGIDVTVTSPPTALTATIPRAGRLIEVPWDTILTAGSLLWGDCPKQKGCEDCRALGCDFCNLSHAADVISAVTGSVSPALQDALEQTNLFNDGTLCAKDLAVSCVTLRTLLFLSNVELNACEAPATSSNTAQSSQTTLGPTTTTSTQESSDTIVHTSESTSGRVTVAPLVSAVAALGLIAQH